VNSATLVLNVAYAVLVGSTFTRRILWLRIALVIAGAMFVLYGVISDNWTMIFWNSVTSVLHARQAIRYVESQRDVTLSPEDAAIHATWFADVEPFDFQTLWTMGETRQYREEALAREGCEQSRLMLILDGSAVVNANGRDIGVLEQGDLVGEMSFISGAPATATVVPQDLVVVREWDQSRLHALDHLNPSAATALRKCIQVNLTEKLLKRSG
jgi:CRP-like cAMP-binding protein